MLATRQRFGALGRPTLAALMLGVICGATHPHPECKARIKTYYMLTFICTSLQVQLLMKNKSPSN